MKTSYITKSALIGLVCLSLGMSSCSSISKTWNGMTQTGQGATAGGAAGAAVGTGVGALIGGGKGAWIGALVGGALGAGTGAVVGNQMQRQKKALQEEMDQLREQNQANSDAINAIKIQETKDSNGLDAIKMVMGSQVLFPTNSSTLSPTACAALAKVAQNLNQFPETDVTVVGFTDNTGTAAINNPLSLKRAEAVRDYLIQCGVPASRLKAIGLGDADPIASNATPEGRAQNRRVELFITANQQMIQQAQNQK
ncbi:MAG: OmpA family protein [Bacteroidales bacterium]|nr:OmpA family protein [Bacteroidales bacterium]MDE7466044.1 OmpA family protein [Muribaculaceae bacterium]